jgi:hypothetical protein
VDAVSSPFPQVRVAMMCKMIFALAGVFTVVSLFFGSETGAYTLAVLSAGWVLYGFKDYARD